MCANSQTTGHSCKVPETISLLINPSDIDEIFPSSAPLNLTSQRAPGSTTAKVSAISRALYIKSFLSIGPTMLGRQDSKCLCGPKRLCNSVGFSLCKWKHLFCDDFQPLKCEDHCTHIWAALGFAPDPRKIFTTYGDLCRAKSAIRDSITIFGVR